jgi:hypothetical protein
MAEINKNNRPQLTEEQVQKRRDEAITRDKALQAIEPLVRAAESNFAADFISEAVKVLSNNGFIPVLQAEALKAGLDYTQFKLESTFRGTLTPICKLFVGPGYDPENPPESIDQIYALVSPVFRKLSAEQREHCSSLNFSWGPTDREWETHQHR